MRQLRPSLLLCKTVEGVEGSEGVEGDEGVERDAQSGGLAQTFRVVFTRDWLHSHGAIAIATITSTIRLACELLGRRRIPGHSTRCKQSRCSNTRWTSRSRSIRDPLNRAQS